MNTLSALATVVIVSRERFSLARQTLENLLAKTDECVSMIYVDGGGPKSLGDYLVIFMRPPVASRNTSTTAADLT